MLFPCFSGKLNTGLTTYTYKVYLNGVGSGKMARNQGYYVVANVNKLLNILLTRTDSEEQAITVEERIIKE